MFSENIHSVLRYTLTAQAFEVEQEHSRLKGWHFMPRSEKNNSKSLPPGTIVKLDVSKVC